jgi:hypothetical protein
MATQKAGLVGMAMLLMAGACDVEDGTTEAVTHRGLEANGVMLNGFLLNGFLLNGFLLNGEKLDGALGTTDYIRIAKIDPKGGAKGTESWLAGSTLAVMGKTGVVSTGPALVDARIEYEVSEGKKVKDKTVRIVSVEPLGPGSDVMLYGLELDDGGWQPLCENGAKAILLGDIWEPATGDRISEPSDGAVTFACRGAALAKCVEYGYRPWATAGAVSLRDHHQACTRMVRADYCGDGVAHTTDGTPIHVLDAVGVQGVALGVDYLVEAEWNADGATCLNTANTRHPGQVINCAIPACTTTSFASGGLIQSGKVLTSL